jgi:hypothetical protein
MEIMEMYGVEEINIEENSVENDNSKWTLIDVKNLHKITAYIVQYIRIYELKDLVD